MIKEIQGDLLDTDCRVIAHGVNCQGVMGSGVAKALYEKWPAVKEQYMDYFINNNAGTDGENFLGEIDDVWVNDKIVVNCFTQQYYGGGDRQYLSYDALQICVMRLIDMCLLNNIKEFAIPKIGAGLAGGDWNVAKAILESECPQDFTIKVYIK